MLVCHDVESLSAGDCLIAELNQPLLSRVAAWEPQERRWHQIFPSITQNSMENESPKLQVFSRIQLILFYYSKGLSCDEEFCRNSERIVLTEQNEFFYVKSLRIM